MKITYKGDYALKALLDLAINREQGLSTIHDIAGRINAPVKFLEQVLLELKSGGFVQSKRGKIGGYFLAKHADQITLGEVVRFIDGPVEPIACVKGKYKGCNELHKCVFRGVWSKVGGAISEIIDNVTFDQLAREASISKETMAYQI